MKMSISRARLPLLKIKPETRLSLCVNGDEPKRARLLLLLLDPKFQSNALWPRYLLSSRELFVTFLFSSARELPSFLFSVVHFSCRALT
jgi:hypothetical protein